MFSGFNSQGYSHKIFFTFKNRISKFSVHSTLEYSYGQRSSQFHVYIMLTAARFSAAFYSDDWGVNVKKMLRRSRYELLR